MFYMWSLLFSALKVYVMETFQLTVSALPMRPVGGDLFDYRAGSEVSGHFGPRTEVSNGHFGSGSEVSGHFGPIIMGPKCLGSEVSGYPHSLLFTIRWWPTNLQHLWISTCSPPHTTGLSGSPGYRQRRFSVMSVKDLFESVHNHSVIDFVNETHFYSLL